MAESILDGKKILAVDDEPDLLEVLEGEILDACKNSHIDKATSYEEASDLLKSETYDLVILDIMGIRGFDLLELAKSRHFPVAMLTAHALNPEALRRSIQMGARAYLPKDKIAEIVEFLEDVLTYEYLPGWERLLRRLEGYFHGRWGKDWQRSEEKIWRELNS